MCGSAILLVMQHEMLVDEDASIYYAEDILAAFPESTAPQAETEDLSVGEDDDWMSSLSSSDRRSYQVIRFDLCATTVRLLTPTPSDDGVEELRSNSSPAEYLDVDGDADAESCEVSNDLSVDGGTNDDAAAAANNSQCSDGVAGSDVNVQMSVEKSTSVVANGNVTDLQNICSSYVISDDRLIRHHISDKRDVQDSMSSAVSEVVENSRSTSSNRVATAVSFKNDDSRVNDDDDERASVELLSACEASSDTRYVSSLYVILASKSGCSADNKSTVVDVSSRMLRLQVFIDSSA